jgi:hypothetical protein
VIAAAWRFPAAAYRYLRQSPLTGERARAILRERLAGRVDSCLTTLRRAIAANPAGPYARLLRACGCSENDLAPLVAREGLEGALAVLARSGVYLRIEEAKGRMAVDRGSERFWIEPGALAGPGLRPAFEVGTGGSRGKPAAIGVDLAFVADHAVDTLATLDAHGGAAWCHAGWTVPGGSSLVNVLEFSRAGPGPDRWFWQLAPAEPGLDRRYRWSAQALRAAARVAGRALPVPEVVGLGDATPIALWMRDTLRRGATPHLWTYASAAVRVARAAEERGWSLGGARFTAGGEPMTAQRRAAIERSGGTVLPRYGSTETDIIGYACARPIVADDQHLLEDRRAVIRAGDAGGLPGLPDGTLLFTSVLPSDPWTLLNVSLGDSARLTSRRCGCPMEALGLPRHLDTIRSFEKLTAGGMTFLDSDVESILDTQLPRLFGGAPTDYQLVDADGHGELPDLRLLVDPRLGPLDGGAVRSAFLAALGERGAGRVMARQWAAAALPRIERRSPRTTAAGKVLHLHRERERDRTEAGESGIY